MRPCNTFAPELVRRWFDVTLRILRNIVFVLSRRHGCVCVHTIPTSRSRDTGLCLPCILDKERVPAVPTCFAASVSRCHMQRMSACFADTRRTRFAPFPCTSALHRRRPHAARLKVVTASLAGTSSIFPCNHAINVVGPCGAPCVKVDASKGRHISRSSGWRTRESAT